jgi:hypothetical protein
MSSKGRRKVPRPRLGLHPAYHHVAVNRLHIGPSIAVVGCKPALRPITVRDDFDRNGRDIGAKRISIFRTTWLIVEADFHDLAPFLLPDVQRTMLSIRGVWVPATTVISDPVTPFPRMFSDPIYDFFRRAALIHKVPLTIARISPLQGDTSARG